MVAKENLEVIFNNLVNGVGSYLKRYNIKSMILGISGGIDSTVVAAICHEVSRKYNIPLYGYALMCNSNQSDEAEAADMVGNAFCDYYRSIDIQPIVGEINTNFKFALGGKKETPISQGNIKARTRMMFLYNAASLYSGIVMDTDNMTEHYLGFWTIHGDEGDLNPIGDLWKHEVYELAHWLSNKYKDDIYQYSMHLAIEDSIKLTPTDGNGVKAGGDLAQIAPGATYNDVDFILKQTLDYIDNKKDESYSTDDIINYIIVEHAYLKREIVEQVVKRFVTSGFKRRHRPIVIDINTGRDK